MKRFATVLFVIVVIAVTSILVIYRRNSLNTPVQQQESVSHAKTIIPLTDKDSQIDINSTTEEEAANTLTSLAPLLPTETLLATQDIDFDADGYDDQINAVKRTTSPNISLIISLFNPSTSSYERSASIDTAVSQIKTFAFFCMDLTGFHQNSLIYTGISDNSLSVLEAFQSVINDREITLTKIVDIQTYGSVSIQQISRSDAYALSQANGESYPIIENVTDNSSGNNSLDQLQIVYNWDRRIGQYVKKSETRIPGKKIAADVLASIQDGTVETFTSFLDGLWYQTSSESSIRYVFFNKTDNEIVFLVDDTEEVYLWDDNRIRRNGIYLSCINTLIANLKRRIDITLTGIDEIKLKLDDDVGMTIKTDNLWDGQYKKMSVKTDFTVKTSATDTKNALDFLQESKNWQTADGMSLSFANNLCSIKTDTSVSTARLVLLSVGDEQLLQFRTESGVTLFDGTYKLVQGDTATLVPVDLTITGYTQSSKVPISLTKLDLPNEE